MLHLRRLPRAGVLRTMLMVFMLMCLIPLVYFTIASNSLRLYAFTMIVLAEDATALALTPPLRDASWRSAIPIAAAVNTIIFMLIIAPDGMILLFASFVAWAVFGVRFADAVPWRTLSVVTAISSAITLIMMSALMVVARTA